MSNRRMRYGRAGSSVLRSGVIVAFAALVAGCASTTPAAAPPVPAPEASAPSPTPTPEVRISYDCTEVIDPATLPADMRLISGFAQLSRWVTASVGGFSCFWRGEALPPAESGVGMVVIPASAAGEVELLDETCGELPNGLAGCSRRDAVGEYLAETTVWGDPAAAATSELLRDASTALLASLDGVAPDGDARTALPALNCDVDLSGSALPDDVGPFGGPGGTDASVGWSSLHDAAAGKANLRTGCVFRSAAGFLVNVTTMGLGSRLLDDPVFIGESQEITLDAGRPARMDVGEEPGVADRPPMPFASTVLPLDGYLVLVSTIYQGAHIADLLEEEPPPAAGIESAAIAVTSAVAAALEASLAEGR